MTLSSTYDYTVSGMSCDHCVQAVTAEVTAVEGVQDASADLATGRLTVVGAGFTDDAVRAAVEQAGYELG